VELLSIPTVCPVEAGRSSGMRMFQAKVSKEEWPVFEQAMDHHKIHKMQFFRIEAVLYVSIG